MKPNDPSAPSSVPSPPRGEGSVAVRAWQALAAAERYGLQLLRARRRDGAIVDWEWLELNRAALEPLGLDPAAPDAPGPSELRGDGVLERIPGAVAETLLERVARAARGPSASDFEHHVPERDRGDGEGGAWFHVTVVPDVGDDPDPQAPPTVLVVTRAITEYKALLRHAVDLMNHDDLTGLANRRLLKARFWVRRRRDQSAALLYFDLNGFKKVNDTHGHEVGDRVLEITAQRLEKNTRPDEIVARIGGDEFAVLLAVSEPLKVQRVVRRLERAVSAPIHLGPLHLHVSAAVGIAYHPDDGDTFEALMSTSDRRMYERKRDMARAVREGET